MMDIHELIAEDDYKGWRENVSEHDIELIIESACKEYNVTNLGHFVNAVLVVAGTLEGGEKFIEKYIIPCLKDSEKTKEYYKKKLEYV